MSSVRLTLIYNLTGFLWRMWDLTVCLSDEISDNITLKHDNKCLLTCDLHPPLRLDNLIRLLSMVVMEDYSISHNLISLWSRPHNLIQPDGSENLMDTRTWKKSQILNSSYEIDGYKIKLIENNFVYKIRFPTTYKVFKIQRKIVASTFSNW